MLRRFLALHVGFLLSHPLETVAHFHFFPSPLFRQFCRAFCDGQDYDYFGTQFGKEVRVVMALRSNCCGGTLLPAIPS